MDENMRFKSHAVFSQCKCMQRIQVYCAFCGNPPSRQAVQSVRSTVDLIVVLLATPLSSMSKYDTAAAYEHGLREPRIVPSRFAQTDR